MASINSKKSSATMEFDRTLVSLMTGEINVVNDVFAEHKVNAGVIPSGALITPAFLTYRITLGSGVRVGKITKLRHELTNALSRFRKKDIGVRMTETPLLLEVPHPDPKPVSFLSADYLLQPNSMLVGQSYTDQDQHNVVINLKDTPHVLVSATTGAGKSMMLTVGALSLCEQNKPSDVILHLIDLKNSDLVPLKNLPHVDTFAGNEEETIAVLAKLDTLRQARIDGADKGVWHVVFIDELAEAVKNPVAMKYLESLLGMGRSLNINIIAATQHPLSAVIGSLIKANFPARLVGRVTNNDASKVASGIPMLGAEHLPGKGAFLLVDGGGAVTRLQGYYIAESEVRDLVQGVCNRFATSEDGQKPQGSMIRKQLDQYQRLKLTSGQPGLKYPSDVVQFASRMEVIEVFNRYYNRESGEMLWGWQASMVRALYGQKANRGGSFRNKALTVANYLKEYPPAP